MLGDWLRGIFFFFLVEGHKREDIVGNWEGYFGGGGEMVDFLLLSSKIRLGDFVGKILLL